MEITSSAEANQKETLPGLVAALFELLQKHIELVPVVVRELLGSASGIITARWPELKRDSAHGLAVASLLFLRVITPALISPDTFGLVSAKCMCIWPTEKRTYTLTGAHLHKHKHRHTYRQASRSRPC